MFKLMQFVPNFLNFGNEFLEMLNNLLKLIKYKNLIAYIAGLWIFIIFSSWDLLQYSTYREIIWPSQGDFLYLNNIFKWVQFSLQFYNDELTNLSSYPIISLTTPYIFSLMIKVFGFEISYFIISTLFPTLSFILMTLIMNSYISWRWSITLSSIAFLSFNSLAFRIFLIELLKGNGWADLGVLEKPIVMGVPFPSLSILVFLLSLYFSVILKRTSHIMIILLSLVWGIQSQFHILNGIFGFPLYLFFILDLLNKKRKSENKNKFQKKYLIHLLIIIPFLYSYVDILNYSNLFKVYYIHLSDDFIFILLAYFVFPLLLLLSAYLTCRVDPKELIFYFLPIWILMSIELILVIVWNYFQLGIPTYFLMDRFGIIILHMLYFIPPIYVYTKHFQNYSKGSESLFISKFMRKLLNSFFNSGSIIILPITLFLISIFSLASTFISYNQSKSNFNLEKIEFLRNSQSVKLKEINYLGSNFYDTISTSINLNMKTFFSENIFKLDNIDERIERLSLIAALYKWNEKEFMLFMKKDSGNFSKKNFDLKTKKPIVGFGYWLTFNNLILKDEEYMNYLKKCKKIYENTYLNIPYLLKKYNVLLVQEDQNLANGLNLIKKSNFWYKQF